MCSYMCVCVCVCDLSPWLLLVFNVELLKYTTHLFLNCFTLSDTQKESLLLHAGVHMCCYGYQMILHIYIYMSESLAFLPVHSQQMNCWIDLL